MKLLILYRDSDASAPAEFPPDQPEADLTADGEEYGAEEAEEEEEELAEGAEGAAVDPDAMVQDSEMAGVDGQHALAAGEESDAGSEDLEAESSGSEDEELEDEEEVEGEGEGDGDEAMDLVGHFYHTFSYNH
jgi:histone chaperone ASF1